MKKRLSWLLVVIVLVAAGITWYYYSSNSDDKSKTEATENTVGEVDKILNRDLEESYPYTVREVIQFFVRIQKCYYNEDYTEEELVKLAYKGMELFDTELKNENPFDEYFSDLKDEVEAYKSEEKIINRVIIDKSSEVTYSTVDEQKYASINCTYYLKSKEGTSKVQETYILRKDETGRWKILGWKEYEENQWE